MSAKFIDEYICKNGHYYQLPDPYGMPQDRTCPECKAEPQFFHSIDITNGVDGLDPATYPDMFDAPKQVLTETVVMRPVTITTYAPGEHWINLDYMPHADVDDSEDE